MNKQSIRDEVLAILGMKDTAAKKKPTKKPQATVQTPSKKLIGKVVLDAFRTQCMFDGTEYPSWPKVDDLLKLSKGVRTKKQVKNTLYKLVDAGYLVPNKRNKLIAKSVNTERTPKYFITPDKYKAAWLAKYNYYTK